MPRFSDFFKPSSGRRPNGNKSSHNVPRARRRAAKSGGLLLLLILLVSLISLPQASRAQFQSQTTPNQGQKRAPVEFVPGEVIVRFRSEEAAELNESDPAQELPVGRGRIPVRTERMEGLGIVKGLRVVRVPAEDTLEAVEALKRRADVLYAEPNYVRRKFATPNDPSFKDLWGLKNTGAEYGGYLSTAGSDIEAEAAWNITTGNRSVVVGVVDEGIDVNHPDLQANIWKNPGEVANNGIDDDANGFIDDTNGWDFFHNDKTVFDGTGAYPSDDTDAHGTHVAGTIGATGNNGQGVVGVNWQTSLMSLKILGREGEGMVPSSVLVTVRAFNYAKMMRDKWVSSGGTKGANIRVLNNSYGGGGLSLAELDAIKALNTAGILFVAAAGNEESNNDGIPAYPASYKVPNVVSVAATNSTDSFIYFSNYGPQSVATAAPGVAILSTTPGGTYATLSGTSMAAPHVAGTAALVCARYPATTLKRLRAAVVFGGESFYGSELTWRVYSGRRLSALKALQSAAKVDTTPPAAVTNFRQMSQDGRSVRLEWKAPGDNGTTGRAALYEIRFTDTQPTTAAQFEAGLPYSYVALPSPVGYAEHYFANIPFRHASGFMSIRALDNVGNAGPISSVPVSLGGGDLNDPYIVSTGPAAPLSTGGTRLNVRGDDIHGGTYALPFVFPFYGIPAQTVTVSTNGALYVDYPDASIPNQWINDARSSVYSLIAFKKIAGLWDDLRTDVRASDDIYVVKPDANRTIFRWQAVTYDTQLSNGTTRGHNPVSFEIEINRNGVIKVRYGAGNQKLWPVVGMSYGEPDSYPVLSHTSESTFKSLANAQTVIYTPRDVAFPKAQVASLSFTPSTVVMGNATTGKVTLAAPAPAGGAVITLNGNTVNTKMPDSITIPAGQTTATFNVTTAYTGYSSYGIDVTATSGYSTQTTRLSLLHPTPVSLVLSPTTVAGGLSVTGTVTVNAPAPANGLVVGLYDALTATTLPVNMTIPAGATKGTFTFKTSAVTASQSGTVRATLNTVAKTAPLTVRPIGVLSVTLTPNPVVGGNSMTGTVVLEGRAPTGGQIVTLSDTLASATTPVSVNVAAGTTTKTFTVTTADVNAMQKGTLTATANAVSKSVVFTLNP